MRHGDIKTTAYSLFFIYFKILFILQILSSTKLMSIRNFWVACCSYMFNFCAPVCVACYSHIHIRANISEHQVFMVAEVEICFSEILLLPCRVLSLTLKSTHFMTETVRIELYWKQVFIVRTLYCLNIFHWSMDKHFHMVGFTIGCRCFLIENQWAK